MKTLGLLGGMTWHSTVDYYRLINQGVQKRLGGSHGAELLLLSIDFVPVGAATPTEGFARTRRDASGYFDIIFCAGKLLVPYRVTRPVTLP